MTSRFLKAAATTLLVSFFTNQALAASPADQQSIDVVIDQTQLLHLKKPMGSIIVGNPNVATVSVHDDHTLLLTGISFGATNLIVLDSIGREIHSSQLLVTERGDSGILTVARGSDQTDIYTCNEKCRTISAEE